MIHLALFGYLDDCPFSVEGRMGRRKGKEFTMRTVLTVIFILVSIALAVLVLMQEGKSAGLGAISGMAETYWGKNKSRSMEGKMVQITTWLTIIFMVLAAVLNLTRF